MSYLSLIRREYPLLSFGFLLTMLSGFGQTFFISLYGAEIREAYHLGNADFGLVYAVASTLNAVVLMWVGKFVDDIDLRLYTACALLGIAAGCLLMWSAASVFALGAGFFLLRLCGQGLMPHISSTAVIRYVEEGRAKALSLSSMGHKMSEILFPALAVFVLLFVEWRESWLAYVAIIVFIMIPLMLLLLRGHGGRHENLLRETERKAQEAASDPAKKKTALRRQWSRAEVLKDTRFYLVIPGLIVPAFVGTMVFFHQSVLIEHKGWTKEWFALMFTPYALSGVAGAFLGAPLVDRYGALKVLPWVMTPFTLGLALLASFSHPFAAFLYMVLAGISSGGIVLAVSGPLWAESYGVQHIGSIRAFMHSVVLLSTAVAPPLAGWFLDAGVHFNSIAWGCMVYSFAASILLAVAARRFAQPGWADLLPVEERA